MAQSGLSLLSIRYERSGIEQYRSYHVEGTAKDEVNKIVNGKILHILGDEVWIDVGYKSEGVIPLEEWKDEALDKVVPPRPGDTVQVLLEEVEDEKGVISLSYRKAKRQKEWEDV